MLIIPSKKNYSILPMFKHSKRSSYLSYMDLVLGLLAPPADPALISVNVPSFGGTWGFEADRCSCCADTIGATANSPNNFAASTIDTYECQCTKRG